MIIKSEQYQIQDYLKDASNTTGYCDAVYFPESATDIQNILKEATHKKIPVTICGNRTGLTGSAVPRGGIVISTEKLNKIIEINTTEKYVIVEPGVLLSDLINELRKYNLYYPPDPTELNCFIGGTVATNASGAKSFKYGATRNFVIGLELVLSNGNTIIINRNETRAIDFRLKLRISAGRMIDLQLPELKNLNVKNAAGFYSEKEMDGIDLFIGSEGTLGVFTKIKLAILDYPKRIFSAIIFLTAEKDALDFISEARELSLIYNKKRVTKSITATSLEFLDKYSLILLRAEHSHIPQSATAAVLLEQETTNEEYENVSEEWIELIKKHNGKLDESWIAVSERDKKEIEKFRHSISVKVNEYIASKNLRKLGTDIAVPTSKFHNFYYYLINEVQNNKIEYVVYGHFGDCHIHLNMLPKNEKEYEIAKTLYDKFCRRAIKTGGTFSAEHGVGKNKKEYLKELYGEEAVKKMVKIKRKLDPDLTLGIGNIFDVTDDKA